MPCLSRVGEAPRPTHSREIERHLANMQEVDHKQWLACLEYTFLKMNSSRGASRSSHWSPLRAKRLLPPPIYEVTRRFRGW